MADNLSVKNYALATLFILAVLVTTILLYAGLAVILIIVLASPFWFILGILAWKSEFSKSKKPN